MELIKEERTIDFCKDLPDKFRLRAYDPKLNVMQ